MRFLVDNQLPAALAEWLRTNHYHAEHVLEVGLAQAKDSPVWNFAHIQGAVVLTKDEDFAEWVRRGRAGPQVVWLRIGNTSNEALIQWLAPLFPAVLGRLAAGDRLVEVR